MEVRKARCVKKTYRLILPVLEHALGEVPVVPRVGDLAVVALVLDLWTSDAERAANEAFRLRAESALVCFGGDDHLLQVDETVGGVLVLLFLDTAFIARDAIGCQLAGSMNEQAAVSRTWAGAQRCCTSRALSWLPLWLVRGVVWSVCMRCAATDKAPVQADGSG